MSIIPDALFFGVLLNSFILRNDKLLSVTCCVRAGWSYFTDPPCFRGDARSAHFATCLLHFGRKSAQLSQNNRHSGRTHYGMPGSGLADMCLFVRLLWYESRPKIARRFYTGGAEALPLVQVTQGSPFTSTGNKVAPRFSAGSCPPARIRRTL